MKKNKDKVTYDIEEYRKKKKREKAVRRLIRVMAAVVLLLGAVGGVYFYQEYDLGGLLYQSPNSQAASQETSVQTGSFPISLDSVTPLELEPFQDGTLLLTDEELLVIHSDGSVPNQFVHSFTNPVLRIGHDQFLLYDRGGYGYRMENEKGSIASGRTTASIQAGACGYNSHFALVAADPHYAASVTVYDKSGQELLTWYSLEQVVDAAFSQDDRYLAVASVLFQNDGALVSRIHLLDIEKEKEVGSVDYKDALSVAVHVKSDGQIHLVTDSFLGVVSADLSEQRQIPYLQQLRRYQFSDTATLLINSGASEVSSAVSLVSANGDRTEQMVQSSVLDCSLQEDGVCLLTGNGVLWYSSKLEQQGSHTVASEVFQVSRSGDSLYMMSPSQLNQVDLREHTGSSAEEEENS